jgi:hypothetical protein
MIPSILFRANLSRKLSALEEYDRDYIMNRVNYYNKLEHDFHVTESMIQLRDFNLRGLKRLGISLKHSHAYFFDTWEYIRYFPLDNWLAYRYGDVTDIPAFPSIVKSRPIDGDNQNSILLKLNKVRHFMFASDKKSFQDKQNRLVGRNRITKAQIRRAEFWEMYFGHPLCDLGATGTRVVYPQWHTDFMTIADHLDFKFILCLEGNDVASNLKWVMSSNSIAVMPEPVYETWFMEGTLIPDVHYIAIKKDYSDLERKLNYYLQNTDKALEIIENAHRYVKRFQDRKCEDLVSLLTLQKYFAACLKTAEAPFSGGVVNFVF